jgi:hypothetical protein
MTCTTCNTSMRILKIICPEVFVSYQWGQFRDKKYTTQEKVIALVKRVELELDLLCWVDVYGT